MKIFDISWPITVGMTAYKDKKTVQFNEVKNFEQDHARETLITLSAHTGTHVDAPAHFLADGKPIDQVDFATLFGACNVIDCTALTTCIDDLFLQKQNIQEHDIILLKTANSEKNSTDVFVKDFVYLNAAGAQYLVDKKVKSVGIDYLGIEHSQPDHATHTILFSHDITIIEGLRLDHVDPGFYFFICLPLAVVGLEAAPARAILIQEQK